MAYSETHSQQHLQFAYQVALVALFESFQGRQTGLGVSSTDPRAKTHTHSELLPNLPHTECG